MLPEVSHRHTGSGEVEHAQVERDGVLLVSLCGIIIDMKPTENLPGIRRKDNCYLMNIVVLNNNLSRTPQRY